MYWANARSDAIGRANLDGTGVDQSFITGASGPNGVAVNDSHVYWANDIAGTIGRANLDGTGVNQSFITGLGFPLGVAVSGQYIYWADGTGVGRANLDGTGANPSFITGANYAYAVAVDGQHIYWADQSGFTIGVANLDGTGVNDSFINAGVFPSGVAVDGQHIYWTGNNGLSSSVGVANLDGTGVNQSFITGPLDPVGVALSVPVAEVSPAAPSAFATTPQGTLSAPMTVTVSNVGQRNLSLSGLSFAGSDPGDFIVSSNGCLGSVAPGESCQLTVSFVPQAQGARSATLQIVSNDYANSPLSLALSGTGGSLPQGPQGPPGSLGLPGAQGQPGPASKVELVTCKTVTKKIKGHTRRVQKCTSRLVSGPAKFTTSGAVDRATISRGRIAYATGTSVQLGGGRSELLLHDLRALHRGRYTLTVRSPHGDRRTLRRETITII